MSALRSTRRIRVLVGALLALLVIWCLFHRPIQRWLMVRLLLHSPNPTEEFFSDSAKLDNDPVDFLQRCWATGKIVHRQFVAAFLKSNATANGPWRSRAEPLLLACTVDADVSVRELGLGALEVVHSPHLFRAACAQLDDLDPLVRLRGIDYLRRSDPGKAAAILIRALDDPDLRIVTAAEVGLMRCSGVDFGVRARLAIPAPSDAGRGALDSANVEAIRRGVEQRKQWWQVHEKEYDSAPNSSGPRSVVQLSPATRPPAADFTLCDLQGKAVRLSDFRGKVVLLNFWATWCTACLAEIPDLVALQKKMGDRVAILGVALDGVPDEHGDIPGENADRHDAPVKSSLSTVRAKVERAVKARQINYPILLDPRNSVGSQYNGGELPTTVILDPEGRVRRRFVGERNLTVFQAMVAQAARPPEVAAPSLPAPRN